MIAIIDYGLGNIQAFVNVYDRIGISVTVAKTSDALEAAHKLILPGVGAFDHAMELLEGSGMRQTLDYLVLSKHVPMLGICVGMQIMARSSEEGRLPGLAWVDGVVKKLDTSALTAATRLPHMGWNDVQALGNDGLFQGLDSAARFYFLHSYYFECDREDEVVATTEYGKKFPCAVRRGNVYGVQFHPEKSHRYGVQLLKNFAEL